VRQLDQLARELQGLEAQVETQAKIVQGLEQRIREVEGHLAKGQPPAASPGDADRPQLFGPLPHL
jgi:hypothetical protein